MCVFMIQSLSLRESVPAYRKEQETVEESRTFYAIFSWGPGMKVVIVLLKGTHFNAWKGIHLFIWGIYVSCFAT